MTVNERYQIQEGDEVKYRYGREGVKTGTVDSLMFWGMMFSKEPLEGGGWRQFNAAWKDVVSVNGKLVSSPCPRILI